VTADRTVSAVSAVSAGCNTFLNTFLPTHPGSSPMQDACLLTWSSSSYTGKSHAVMHEPANLVGGIQRIHGGEWIQRMHDGGWDPKWRK
jgi:hypothetical protein